jgi:hypothetical protein
MIPKELLSGIRAALLDMLDGLGGKVTALAEILTESPVKVRAGARVTGMSADDLLALIKSPAAFEAFRASLLTQWPAGIVFRLPPKSIAVAADDKTVIFDLDVFTNLTRPLSLTQKI